MKSDNKEKETTSVPKTETKIELIGQEVHASRGTIVSSVIVMLPLLLALITFFVQLLVQLGAEVHWDFTNTLGVFALIIRVNGRVFEWTSSTFLTHPGNRMRLYDIPTIIMNGIALTGNRITPIFRFLDLLGIGHHSKAATVKRQASQLFNAVARSFTTMTDFVRKNIPKISIKVQSDEQHSRNPRARGHAPFCSAIVIENSTGFVLVRVHVWRHNYTGKDCNKLAAMAQNEVFQALVVLVLIKTIILYIHSKIIQMCI